MEMGQSKPAQPFTGFSSHWDSLQFPLRPNADAVASFAALSQRCLSEPPAITHILGLTPELVQAKWLSGSRIYAVDHSPEMINALWPGNDERRTVIQCDWLGHWSQSSAPADLILGDGVFTLYSHPDGLTQLVENLALHQAPDGVLIVRVFGQPKQRLSVPDLFDAAKAGSVSNFHEFKLLLLNALQGTDTVTGVVLQQAWLAFMQGFQSIDGCVAETGWSAAEVSTIKLYAHSHKTYHMATVDEITQALAPHYEYCDHIAVPCSNLYDTPVVAFKKSRAHSQE